MARHMCEGPASPAEFVARLSQPVAVKFIGADMELFKHDVIYNYDIHYPADQETHLMLADRSFRKRLPTMSDAYYGKRCTTVASISARGQLTYEQERRDVTATNAQAIVDEMPSVLVSKVIAVECVYRLLVNDPTGILLNVNAKLSSLLVHTFDDGDMALWTRSSDFGVRVEYVPIESHFRSMLVEVDGLVSVDRTKSWAWVKRTGMFDDEEITAYEAFMEINK